MKPKGMNDMSRSHRPLVALAIAASLAGGALAQPTRPAPPVDRAEAPALPGEGFTVRDGVVEVSDVVYERLAAPDGDERALRLDASFPAAAGEAPLPVVVYVHGGGWRSGSKEAGAPFRRAFARGGYFAVSVEYRLAGEAKFPAAVDDCRAAIRFLRRHADDLGIDPDRIGAWGHSAGGHLSAHLATSANGGGPPAAALPPDPEARIACAVSVSGPADLRALARAAGREGEGANAVLFWLGAGSAEEIERRARDASPIVYVDGMDPPMLLVHGGADRLVSIRQSEQLQAALAEAGVPSALHRVEGAGHGVRDREAYVRVASFFDEHLGGRAAAIVSALPVETRDPARD
jgi:acetyl esterase/lipase